MTRTFALLLIFVAPCLAPSAAPAAETPETILIRQALDADKFGRRRGDAEMVRDILAERFVAYDAGGSADPRGWSVAHETREAYGQHVDTDLQGSRYAIERFVSFIHVRGANAFVTTVDSGQVAPRQGGDATPYKVKRMWFFTKTEDQWLSTGVVENIGDEAPDPAAPASEVSAWFAEEAAAWNDGDAGGLADLAAEGFVGYDGADLTDPAKWVILFSGNEEWEAWINRRLEHSSYDVQRTLLTAHIGPGGDEAVAVTRETVKTAHNGGPAAHTRQRHVLWTLNRSGGSWRVTHMLYNLGLAQAAASQ